MAGGLYAGVGERHLLRAPDGATLLSIDPRTFVACAASLEKLAFRSQLRYAFCKALILHTRSWVLGSLTSESRVTIGMYLEELLAFSEQPP